MRRRDPSWRGRCRQRLRARIWRLTCGFAQPVRARIADSQHHRMLGAGRVLLRLLLRLRLQQRRRRLLLYGCLDPARGMAVVAQGHVRGGGNQLPDRLDARAGSRHGGPDSPGSLLHEHWEARLRHVRSTVL